jgi:hypothetical protein
MKLNLCTAGSNHHCTAPFKDSERDTKVERSSNHAGGSSFSSGKEAAHTATRLILKSVANSDVDIPENPNLEATKRRDICLQRFFTCISSVEKKTLSSH